MAPGEAEPAVAPGRGAATGGAQGDPGAPGARPAAPRGSGEVSADGRTAETQGDADGGGPDVGTAPSERSRTAPRGTRPARTDAGRVETDGADAGHGDGGRAGGGPVQAGAVDASAPTSEALTSTGPGSVLATGPFNSRQLFRIDEALTAADRETGLTFSVYIGTFEEPTRDYVEGLHDRLPNPEDSVLLAVSPNQRTLEIVTGERAGKRLPDRACELAGMSMRAAFGGGDLAGGVVVGLRMLADRARVR